MHCNFICGLSDVTIKTFIGIWAGGLGGCSPPESGKIFFPAIDQFSGSGVVI